MNQMLMGGGFYRPNLVESDSEDSSLVTIFEEQLSMWREYDIMMKTHESVFEDYQKKYNFAMSYVRKQNEPTQITKVFEEIFSKIESEPYKYGKYITILFIIDGRETYEEERIHRKAQHLINKGYNFQFICIGVGNEIPLNIIESLRKAIHTIESRTSMLINVNRPEYRDGKRIPSDINYRQEMIYQGRTQIEKDFRSAFNKVKGFLKIPKSSFQNGKKLQQVPITNNEEIKVIQKQIQKQMVCKILENLKD